MQSKKWDKIFEEHKKYDKKYKLPMLNHYYTTDFNYTICEKYSDIPELL